MRKIDQQMSLADIDTEYQAFVEKFKPKKTTDDCYTPDNVYAVVLQWAVEEYGINPAKVVRPFWPGGDYERQLYPEGCVVLDNPPFSIITKIARTFCSAGISFFLFAPYLTNFSIKGEGITHIITDVQITYENGAKVNTSFVTNLEPEIKVRTSPKLRSMIEEADYINTHDGKKSLPKYEYPVNVLTATRAGWLSKYGQDIKIPASDCIWIDGLESQKREGKKLFGSGYLLSAKAAAEKAAAEKAAAEKAAARVWELSERELLAISSME